MIRVSCTLQFYVRPHFWLSYDSCYRYLFSNVDDEDHIRSQSPTGLSQGGVQSSSDAEASCHDDTAGVELTSEIKSDLRPASKRTESAINSEIVQRTATISTPSTFLHFTSIRIVDATIFAAARSEVFNLMESDTFRRFMLQLRKDAKQKKSTSMPRSSV